VTVSRLGLRLARPAKTTSWSSAKKLD